jgi:hypothetical protein
MWLKGYLKLYLAVYQKKRVMKYVSQIIAVLALLTLGLGCQPAMAQQGDTVINNHYTPSNKQVLRKLALPFTLIGIGAYGVKNTGIINNKEIKEERHEHFGNFEHHADDYLQFAPIPMVFAMDALGFKSTHTWQEQVILFSRAQLMMMAMIYPIKHFTKVQRPDSSAYNSFPSGHTAQAFAGASFFYKEFGRQHPWASAGVFMLASGIGAFRVLNNRHWVSDVLAGAGFGILSVELSYLMYKPRKKNKKQSVFIYPSYSNHSFACSALLRW